METRAGAQVREGAAGSPTRRDRRPPGLPVALPAAIAEAAVPVVRLLAGLIPGVGPSLESAVKGRTILVTGASSGIGHALALKLAAAGGVPLIVARRARQLEELREEIEAGGGSAHVYAADLSDMDAIDRLIARVLGEQGGVDVLV
ncbi:MAG TPA: SDR family NAD(P)-dependent oxidoreductase, partial [Solirubrobacteraceae bacterium]|nr:SDR family NAD(P)-dependent oxidoreductase [Solirubrobacteraceae bacterium]